MATPSDGYTLGWDLAEFLYLNRNVRSLRDANQSNARVRLRSPSARIFATAITKLS